MAEQQAQEPRVVEMPVGIPGHTLRTEQRRIDAEEPPPLPVNEELKVVGQPVPRLDGRAKVTGTAQYTADVRLPGMLYGVLVTAPHPHARIRSIDMSEAEKHPGVKAVHVMETVRGVARMDGDAEHSQYPIVRFAGQPIAGVAATSQSAAEEAARLVKVEYEVQPFVVDVEQARRDDAPVVFPQAAEQEATAGGGGGPRGVPQKGNVRGPATGGTPNVDIEQALAEADVVVEQEYRTQVQTHCPLEPHGVVADWNGDRLTVYASTQGTNSVRDELAEVFELPRTRVRVITEFMGGGFGSKFGAGNYGVVATHLSKKAGAPVKLMLNRRQEHLSAGNRPSSVQKLRIGAKRDGTLVALHASGYGTAGVGTGAGFSGPARSLYRCPAILTEEYDIFTHAGPAAAFRAPGHPQGSFALEQALDELAHKLEMDPLALREKLDSGERNDSLRVQRQIGAERIGWASRHAPGADAGPVKRGLGMAQAIWYRFNNRGSSCEVRITRDGSVEVRSSVQDLGTGIRTALAQVVAEELGLRAEQITVRIGDTDYPAGPGSGGSVTTGSMTPPAREAAWKAKQELFREIAESLDAEPSDLTIEEGQVFPRDGRERAISFRAACGRMQPEDITTVARRREEYTTAEGGRVAGATAGVQFSQVAVDVETGVIKVERVVAVHDCGRPINPLALESQINGGVIQGISYALYEDRILDRTRGLMVNPNLEMYKIAGAMEMPKIEPILIEEYWGRSSTDVAGIGEPVTVPTAAAVANAVFNAIGVRIRQLPMTPAVVLAALREASV